MLGASILPYTGGDPLGGGLFPHFNRVLVILGAALFLSGAGILVRSYWVE